MINEHAKDRLEILSAITFFVVKKDDPYYMYRHFSIDPTMLYTDSVEVPFIVDQEQTKVSLATVQQFNSYGIKEE